MSHLGHGSRLGLQKLLARQTYALCRERVNVFAIQKPGFTLKGCPGLAPVGRLKKGIKKVSIEDLERKAEHEKSDSQ